MRGNHEGSYEVAHALARSRRRDFGPVRDTEGHYDLVVVGAGLSGLTAAFLFEQRHPGARILILDNHDDFGGHAKRNEFEVAGRTLIGYGGTQTFEAPEEYPHAVRQLLRDLGVNLATFESAYDQDFYRRNELAGAIYFDEPTFGSSRLVRHDVAGFWSWLPLAAGETAERAVAAMPLSAPARLQMLRLLTDRTSQFENMTLEARDAYLSSISYADFLKRHLGITEPEVFAALAGLTTDSVADIEQTSAASAFLYATLPGVAVAGEQTEKVFESAPYIHHFPDGMASVARLIVRRLIPGIAPGDSMEDVVTAPFDYARLDLAENATRVRLNSTVINVEHHAGATRDGEEVSVTYVRGGDARRVRARRCILACNNRIIPALCPQLPAAQREALRGRVRAPLMYTNVALTNWRAFKELGVGAIAMPGGYHVNAMLDFPVSLGDYQFSRTPDDPVLLHMERFFTYPDAMLPPPQRFAAARNELMTTPFTTIERNVREQLGRMLGPGGFDPARDIAGITVNRWSHGYAYSYDWMNDEYYDDWNDDRYAHVIGRRPLGPIAIANSDADAIALFPSAAMQALRAVEEVS